MPKRKKFNASELPFMGPRQPTHARCPALLKPGPGPGAYRDMRTMGALSTTSLAVTQGAGTLRSECGPLRTWCSARAAPHLKDRTMVSVTGEMLLNAELSMLVTRLKV